MSLSLEGRVALITGAGSGIGRSHAVLMAERGADLILNDIHADGLAETVEQAAKSGRQIQEIVHDVSEISGMREKTRAAESVCGGIDILVNNAGVSGQRLAFEDVTEDAYDRMLDINLKGSFFLTQTVVPGMKERRYGKIVNTSSMYALGGNHVASHYSAAKSALSGLTNSLARELAEWNIMVNAVAPGFVLTPEATHRSGAAEAHVRRVRHGLHGGVSGLGRSRLYYRSGHQPQWRGAHRRNLGAEHPFAPQGGEFRAQKIGDGRYRGGGGAVGAADEGPGQFDALNLGRGQAAVLHVAEDR
jgi:3-oxoacyl-[acyl-carrier protein] reductase